MFLRLRLRRVNRRLVRLSRRQARLQARYADLGDVLQVLTYKRRFFEEKLHEAAYATTLRGWLRAIFRGPQSDTRRWTGGETPPTPVDELK